MQTSDPTRPPLLLGADGKPLDPFTRHRDDGFAAPAVVTFGSIISGAYNTFFHLWDDALVAGRENALAMRRDPYLMALLEERKEGTASLEWHLVPDNAKDPRQRAVAEGLDRIVRATPRLRQLQYYLLEALWYGRYGSQLQWGWRQMDLPTPTVASSAVPGSGGGGFARMKALVVRKHEPVNGDKIGHFHDGTPYVLCHAGETDRLKGRAEIVTTSMGHAFALSGSWRDRFLLHKHIVDDADYMHSEFAEGIHGIGIRHRVYFLWFLKQEWTSWISDSIERTGLGVVVLTYDASNTSAEAQAKEAAKDFGRRSVFVIPATKSGSEKGGAVQIVEAPVAGAAVVQALREYADKILERYIIGQSLSAGTEGSGLGGSGVAELHKSTKFLRVSGDAHQLAETLAGSEDEPGLVSIIKKAVYPWADFPVRWAYSIPDPEAERSLGVASMLVNLGVELPKDEVRSKGGFSDPTEDEEVISLQTLQAQMPQQPGAAGAGGVPGGAPGGAAAGAPGGQDELAGLLGDLQSEGGAQKMRRSHDELARAVDDAAADVHPEPTDPQREAGNHRMGHVRFHGLDVTISDPKGSVRTKVGEDGTRWSKKMHAHYGYLKRTYSHADGDHVDVYLGDRPHSEIVFVVNQLTAGGDFNEHKAMLGYDNEQDARAAYLAHYPRGWKVGDVVPMTLNQFKRWLQHGTDAPARHVRDGMPLRYAGEDQPKPPPTPAYAEVPGQTPPVPQPQMPAVPRGWHGMTEADRNKYFPEATNARRATQAQWLQGSGQRLAQQQQAPGFQLGTPEHAAAVQAHEGGPAAPARHPVAQHHENVAAMAENVLAGRDEVAQLRQGAGPASPEHVAPSLARAFHQDRNNARVLADYLQEDPEAPLRPEVTDRALQALGPHGGSQEGSEDRWRSPLYESIRQTVHEGDRRQWPAWLAQDPPRTEGEARTLAGDLDMRERGLPDGRPAGVDDIQAAVDYADYLEARAQMREGRPPDPGRQSVQAASHILQQKLERSDRQKSYPVTDPDGFQKAVFGEGNFTGTHTTTLPYDRAGDVPQEGEEVYYRGPDGGVLAVGTVPEGGVEETPEGYSVRYDLARAAPGSPLHSEKAQRAYTAGFLGHGQPRPGWLNSPAEARQATERWQARRLDQMRQRVLDDTVPLAAGEPAPPPGFDEEEGDLAPADDDGIDLTPRGHGYHPQDPQEAELRRAVERAGTVEDLTRAAEQLHQHVAANVPEDDQEIWPGADLPDYLRRAGRERPPREWDRRRAELEHAHGLSPHGRRLYRLGQKDRAAGKPFGESVEGLRPETLPLRDDDPRNAARDQWAMAMTGRAYDPRHPERAHQLKGALRDAGVFEGLLGATSRQVTDPDAPDNTSSRATESSYTRNNRVDRPVAHTLLDEIYGPWQEHLRSGGDNNDDAFRVVAAETLERAFPRDRQPALALLDLIERRGNPYDVNTRAEGTNLGMEVRHARHVEGLPAATLAGAPPRVMDIAATLGRAGSRAAQAETGLLDPEEIGDGSNGPAFNFMHRVDSRARQGDISRNALDAAREILRRADRWRAVPEPVRRAAAGDPATLPRRLGRLPAARLLEGFRALDVPVPADEPLSVSLAEAVQDVRPVAEAYERHLRERPEQMSRTGAPARPHRRAEAVRYATAEGPAADAGGAGPATPKEPHEFNREHPALHAADAAIAAQQHHLAGFRQQAAEGRPAVLTRPELPAPLPQPPDEDFPHPTGPFDQAAWEDWKARKNAAWDDWLARSKAAGAEWQRRSDEYYASLDQPAAIADLSPEALKKHEYLLGQLRNWQFRLRKLHEAGGEDWRDRLGPVGALIPPKVGYGTAMDRLHDKFFEFLYGHPHLFDQDLDDHGRRLISFLQRPHHRLTREGRRRWDEEIENYARDDDVHRYLGRLGPDSFSHPGGFAPAGEGVAYPEEEGVPKGPVRPPQPAQLQARRPPSPTGQGPAQGQGQPPQSPPGDTGVGMAEPQEPWPPRPPAEGGPDDPARPPDAWRDDRVPKVLRDAGFDGDDVAELLETLGEDGLAELMKELKEERHGPA